MAPQAFNHTEAHRPDADHANLGQRRHYGLGAT